MTSAGLMRNTKAARVSAKADLVLEAAIDLAEAVRSPECSPHECQVRREALEVAALEYYRERRR